VGYGDSGCMHELAVHKATVFASNHMPAHWQVDVYRPQPCVLVTGLQMMGTALSSNAVQ
jgi:hypothetical protein